jgi:hypothetical protein
VDERQLITIRVAHVSPVKLVRNPLAWLYSATITLAGPATTILAFSMSFTPMVTYPIILVFSCLFGEECYTSQNKKTEGEPSVFLIYDPEPVISLTY